MSATDTTTPAQPVHLSDAATAIVESLRRQIELDTETDTLHRARWRVAAAFAAMYDDEPGEPDQAIRDLLTDLLHEADARGVDLQAALDGAEWMQQQEREEWAEVGR